MGREGEGPVRRTGSLGGAEWAQEARLAWLCQLTCSCRRSQGLGKSGEQNSRSLSKRDSSWGARAQVSPHWRAKAGPQQGPGGANGRKRAGSLRGRAGSLRERPQVAQSSQSGREPRVDRAEASPAGRLRATHRAARGGPGRRPGHRQEGQGHSQRRLWPS